MGVGWEAEGGGTGRGVWRGRTGVWGEVQWGCEAGLPFGARHLRVSQRFLLLLVKHLRVLQHSPKLKVPLYLMLALVV